MGSLRRSGNGCWVKSVFFGITGYSDDSLLIAPSLTALQEMLSICESYAEEHNLKFSTDKNPSKSKTKCLAFQRKPQDLPQLTLCGNQLPWVSSGKHLGNQIENRINGQKADIKIKRANYIGKNNELLQEFFFSHPKTKVHLNSIYNSHLTGSCLWDLFSPEAVMMENTWNTSIRLMYDLPRQTHRNLIEPISETNHIRFHLIKRFLSFINQIENSPKQASKHLLKTVKHDARSTSGSNLRNILLMTDKYDVDDLNPSDARLIKYHPLNDDETWKVNFILEATDVKFEQLEVDGFQLEEIEEIIDYLCCS